VKAIDPKDFNHNDPGHNTGRSRGSTIDHNLKRVNHTLERASDNNTRNHSMEILKEAGEKDIKDVR